MFADSPPYVQTQRSKIQTARPLLSEESDMSWLFCLDICCPTRWRGSLATTETWTRLIYGSLETTRGGTITRHGVRDEFAIQ